MSSSSKPVAVLKELHGFYSTLESRRNARNIKLEGRLWQVFELHGQKGQFTDVTFVANIEREEVGSTLEQLKVLNPDTQYAGRLGRYIDDGQLNEFFALKKRTVHYNFEGEKVSR